LPRERDLKRVGAFFGDCKSVKELRRQVLGMYQVSTTNVMLLEKRQRIAELPPTLYLSQ